jgi:hypothetical protein
MLFLFVEFLPIFEVLAEVDLISSPEGSEVFLVHLKDGVIVDGEEHKAALVGCEDGFCLFCGSEERGGVHANLN